MCDATRGGTLTDSSSVLTQQQKKTHARSHCIGVRGSPSVSFFFLSLFLSPVSLSLCLSVSSLSLCLCASLSLSLSIFLSSCLSFLSLCLLSFYHLFLCFSVCRSACLSVSLSLCLLSLSLSLCLSALQCSVRVNDASVHGLQVHTLSVPRSPLPCVTFATHELECSMICTVTCSASSRLTKGVRIFAGG